MDALFGLFLNTQYILYVEAFIFLNRTALFKLLIANVLFSGHIYVIGGSTNMRLPENSSRVVSRINLGSGAISRTQPLLEPTSGPAVASSQNMIAVCGGSSNGSLVSTCQVYSITETMYV